MELNNDFTLGSLISSLEKSAGFPFEKDDSKSEDKKDDEKKEDKKDDEKKEDKKDEKEQEKSAAFKSGSDLAKEIMEKVASIQIEKTQTQGEEMNKQASDAGKALAQSILTKMAGLGDINTTNGIAPGVAGNKTQQDLAAQVAEHDAIIQATPGTDGAGNGGTINQIFDAIVADAKAKGVVDQFGQSSSAAAEGARDAAQTPNQVPVAAPSAIGDGQEKAAAVMALVNGGADFDQAVEMVKAASDELEAEHDNHVKQAALNELLENGVNFDMAVALVKQLS